MQDPRKTSSSLLKVPRDISYTPESKEFLTTGSENPEYDHNAEAIFTRVGLLVNLYSVTWVTQESPDFQFSHVKLVAFSLV